MRKSISPGHKNTGRHTFLVFVQEKRRIRVYEAEEMYLYKIDFFSASIRRNVWAKEECEV